MASKSISVTLRPFSDPEKRTTKNAWRFEEVLDGEFDAPKLGQLYVPKTTLGGLGFAGGEDSQIKVTVEIV
jgi:hypothetical protein